MNAKTIAKILAGKVSGWVDSIEDGAVRELAGKNAIVTGGCIASMLLGEPVNDFDIYFRDKATAEAVARYYVGRFNATHAGHDIRVECREDDRVKIVVRSGGVAEDASSTQYVSEVMDDPGNIQDAYEQSESSALLADDEYRPVFLSTNAITLSGRVQLVIRFYGDPDEIHKNYDFVHCTNYWTNSDGKLALRQPALEALLAKELVYIGSKYPLCSIIRLRKFIKRGWTINAGQILKAAMQLSALDLTNIAVLEDQLTGVDCSYFSEVIRKLRDESPEKVNCAYLVEIIDRMF